jgi:hypothetical protein
MTQIVRGQVHYILHMLMWRAKFHARATSRSSTTGHSKFTVHNTQASYTQVFDVWIQDCNDFKLKIAVPTTACILF